MLTNNTNQTPRCRFRRTSTGTLAVVLLLAISSGCASLQNWKNRGYKVGPNYCKPCASTEVEWIDMQSEPQLTTADPDIASWWELFDDPILNELVETTVRDNLTLKQTCKRIEQASAIRRVTAGNLFPQVQQGVGSYQTIDNSRNVAIPAPVEQFDQFNIGMSAAWELDIWGRFRRSISAADANLEASIASYDDISVLLMSSVALTYTEIRTLQERIELTRENIASQEGSLELAETRFKAKKSNKLDVLRGQNNLSFTKAAIPALESQLRVANNRLCVLLGMPPVDLVSELPVGSIPVASLNVNVGIPADLLRRRPDIRRSERLMQAQSERIGIAEAELYPKIALVGSFQLQAEDLDNLLSTNSIFSALGPSFKWNILNYGRIRNSVKAEKARFHETIFRYQEDVLNAQQEVEDAIAGYLNAQKRTHELRSAVSDVVEASEISTTLYRTGAIDFGQVFVLQSVQLSQQDQLVASVANESLSLIKLYKALGGGWQYRLGHRSAKRPQYEPYVDESSFDNEGDENQDPETNDDAANNKENRTDDKSDALELDDGESKKDANSDRPEPDTDDDTVKEALESIKEAVDDVEGQGKNK